MTLSAFYNLLNFRKNQKTISFYNALSEEKKLLITRYFKREIKNCKTKR